MSKENAAINEEITEEQRTRISQNFRAAKALLARKRPRETSANFLNRLHQRNGDANRIETLAQAENIKRLPLAEVSINTPSPFSKKGFKTTDGECEKSSCSGGITINRSKSVHDGLCVRAVGVPLVDGFILDSSETPMKGKVCPSVGDSLMSTNILDDDLCESILEEIDALCEQKSAAKTEGQCPNSVISMESQFRVKNGGKDSSNWGSVDAEKFLLTASMLRLEGDLNSGAEQAAQPASMPDEYSKYLQSLNDTQREAACSDISIPLMIVAGPGSGKTSTMVGRILMLLNEGISPSNILAMTFTTAAASEMSGRIAAVAGKETAKEVTVSTFHSFALQLCRSHAEKLGRTSEFLIYGHGQQRRAIIEAVRIFETENSKKNNNGSKVGEESNDINSPQNFKDKSKKWQKFVTQAKASGKTPEECRNMGDEIGASILGNYSKILRTCNALDYHDLISCSVKLLSDFPEVFRECQESWKAVVIDEFQDTSAMQYCLLRILASHNRITIVGDEDQSIFSFNGADVSGFNSFRKDFPNHKEIRLNKNYRSTRCILEAASSLIQNNMKRCQSKKVLTDNSTGSRVTIKECHSEEAQCAFVVDKILEITSDDSVAKYSFGSVAILYRRQVSGKVFQTAFRDRKIPFNIHGVAFYRKKVVRAIVAMLRTTLSGCDDGSYRQVFKALLPCDKEDKKRVIEHIDKISITRKCSFVSAASDIFSAKVSGTFKRSQLTQGRKVLFTLDMISKLVHREQSISAVITSVANMIPQKYLLEQRAVVDVDGGKLLNEDNDIRSVLQYLLDDVSDFLSTKFTASKEESDIIVKEGGCGHVLKAFIDFISERERENFRSRRHDNEESVTLTTIHQSKGLEWDTVFIVKANESEIPLLHEFNGVVKENGTSIEEERRLLYVGMTRARKKLFILYVLMDSSWQMLQPSRFLKEIPHHLLEVQGELSVQGLHAKQESTPIENAQFTIGEGGDKKSSREDILPNEGLNIQIDECSKETTEPMGSCDGNSFLRRFNVEDRSVVSHLFHHWAKKQAFQEPKRLLDKVGFAIDERLRVTKNKHKDALRELKSSLKCDEAFHYAEYILKWEKIPADKRAHLMRMKQEHFLKLRIENAMGSSAPTSKQISYLQNLGCTVAPTSRLHASHLIEQYKSL